MRDFLLKHLHITYSVLVTITLVALVWYINYDSLSGLLAGLAPNIVYGLFIFLIVRFVPGRNDKLIKDFINRQESNHNQSDQLLKDFIDKQERNHMFTLVGRIQSSRDLFTREFPSLTNLWDSFIEERICEIEQGKDGKIEFASESQRDSFIEKLFNHLEAIPNLSKIQSVTWDSDDGYFTDYWREMTKNAKFAARNEKAESKNIEVQRLFIFRRSSMDDQRKNLYRRLYSENQKTKNTHMRWIYEEDIKKEHLELYKAERSSFLLLIDKSESVKIVTQNYQIDDLYINKKSNAIFYRDAHVELPHILRFKKLYEQAISSNIA